MITKEEIKKQVDNLPENLLNEVYVFLRRITSRDTHGKPAISRRNFNGKLDNTDLRHAAYE